MESIANQSKSLKTLLSDLKNHRRVLLIYGRDDAQHYLIEQQEALTEMRDQLSDLEVIVLIASLVPEPDRQFLMHDYQLLPSEPFVAWLISKDGNIEKTYKQPVDPQTLLG